MTTQETALLDFLAARCAPPSSVRRVILSPAALNAYTASGRALAVPVLEELGASPDATHLTATLVHTDGTLTSRDFE